MLENVLGTIDLRGVDTGWHHFIDYRNLLANITRYLDSNSTSRF